MENRRSSSSLLQYVGAGLTLAVIAHTVKIIVTDPLSGSLMQDLIGYAIAMAVGAVVMFLAFSFLFPNIAKREDDEKITLGDRMKSLLAVVCGMVATAGVMAIFVWLL